jgi:hypothetical protein
MTTRKTGEREPATGWRLVRNWIVASPFVVVGVVAALVLAAVAVLLAAGAVWVWADWTFTHDLVHLVVGVAGALVLAFVAYEGLA